MKSLLITLMLLLSLTGVAQTTTNTPVQKTEQVKTVNTSKDTKVGHTMIKGTKYLVYKTARGSYYIVKTNKKGKQYKHYSYLIILD